MASMNSLTLSGNLTRDFEFNKGVAKSGLAVSTWDKKTFFIDVVAFKQNAEYIIKQKFGKGDLVVASGELNINTYNEKKYVQFIVREIDRFSKKKDDDVEIVNEPKESGVGLGEPKEAEVKDEEIEITTDDLPF